MSQLVFQCSIQVRVQGKVNRIALLKLIQIILKQVLRLLKICWLIDTQWHWGGMSSHSYMNWLDDDWKRFTVKYFLTNNSCKEWLDTCSLLMIDRKLWISVKPFLSFFYLKKLRKIERMKCFKTNCTFLKFIFGDALHTFMDCTQSKVWYILADRPIFPQKCWPILKHQQHCSGNASF